MKSTPEIWKVTILANGNQLNLRFTIVFFLAPGPRENSSLRAWTRNNRKSRHVSRTGFQVHQLEEQDQVELKECRWNVWLLCRAASPWMTSPWWPTVSGLASRTNVFTKKKSYKNWTHVSPVIFKKYISTNRLIASDAPRVCLHVEVNLYEMYCINLTTSFISLFSIRFSSDVSRCKAFPTIHSLYRSFTQLI